MLEDVILTIDDAPSMLLSEKVDFLRRHSIPALFYVRGVFVEQYRAQVVYAIAQGFPIGNHTYSHPSFSQIPLAQCMQEIVRTELLIEACYEEAGVVRPFKTIRFPFGDRGAGSNGRSATTTSEQEKVAALQRFLQKEQFQPLHLPTDGFLDMLWDWDTQDYKAKHFHNPMLYRTKLMQEYAQYPHKSALVLLHDFAHSEALFTITMQFLLDKGVQFRCAWPS